jgi:CRP/FNR family cyclic AMP-dependent transcriptional regulator
MFGLLRDTDRARIAALVIRKHAGKNEVLLLREDPVATLYILAAGRVKLVATGEDGKEVVLSTRGAGEFFGDLSLFDDEPVEATVIAMEPVELLLLRREDLYRCLKEWPDLAIGLLRTLSRRLRHAEGRITTLALLDVPQRVARTLLDLADQHDGNVIPAPVTHRFLAQVVGTSRETVSRVMSQLADDGVVAVTREVLAVPDRRSSGAAALPKVELSRRAIRIVDRPRLELAAGG